MLNVFRKSIFIAILSLVLAPWSAFASGQHEGQSERILTELSKPEFVADRFDPEIPKQTVFTFAGQGTLTISEDTVININHHVYNPRKNLREAVAKKNLLTMRADQGRDVIDYIYLPNQDLDESVVVISSGWARFEGSKEVENGSSFNVATPSVTAGGNGAEFLIMVDPKGKTTLMVSKGQITAYSNLSDGNKDKLSLISAGESQDFYPDGSKSKVRRLLRSF